MIKLLIFDAGDLLWENNHKYYKDAMKRFYKKYEINGRIVNSRWNKIKKKVEVGKIKYKESIKIQFKDFGLSDRALEEWFNVHMDKELTRKKLYPFVKPTLIKLKKHYKLAILTDDYKGREQKRRICRKLHIDIFDGVFSSQDMDCKKPQRKAYFNVLNYFNVKPSEAIFIGHDKDEIDGARKFKIKTIAFNPKKGIKSDFYIKSFSEIPKILENIK